VVAVARVLAAVIGPSVATASVGFEHDLSDRRRPSSVGADRGSQVTDSTAALVADLQAVVGARRARAEPLELALYERDAGVMRGHAGAVCFPANASDVAAAVRVAAAHERPFVARGSGTGLAGGATPVDDPVVVVTTQLNRILEIDLKNRLAIVEPA